MTALAKLRTVTQSDLPRLNELLARKQVPAVFADSDRAKGKKE